MRSSRKGEVDSVTLLFSLAKKRTWGINSYMSAINIYSVPQVAHLTVAGVNARKHMVTHSAYGRSTFKLFRRVDNDFDFLVRDIDRQPVVLPGAMMFHIWDDTGSSLLSLPLTVANSARGHYRLSIPAADTTSIRSGIYVWSVTNENSSITKLLYTNQDYGSQGILEVAEGLLEPVEAPYEIEAEAMTPLGGDLHSSSLPGSLLVNNLTGNHSMVAHLEGYTGRIIIKATLDEQPPAADNDWVDVHTEVFTNVTGGISVNFQGNFTFVKFVASNAEGFTKITYRN